MTPAQTFLPRRTEYLPLFFRRTFVVECDKAGEELEAINNQAECRGTDPTALEQAALDADTV